MAARTLTLRLDAAQAGELDKLMLALGEKAATRAIARAVRELPGLRRERDDLAAHVAMLTAAIVDLEAAQDGLADAKADRDRARSRLRELSELPEEARSPRPVSGEIRPAHRGAGRVAVLGRREEIAAALAEGYSKRQVWELLRDQGALAIGYETFSRHVGEALAANAAVGGGNEERSDADGSKLARR